MALARERLSRCTGLELVQFSQLASYELAWSYAFLLDWPQVDAIFGRLVVDNEWSKAFYAQMQAVSGGRLFLAPGGHLCRLPRADVPA